MSDESHLHRAILFHPPSYDIRVQDVPMPQIQHPDDAIVKVKLAALCGSDLHIYRGHAGVQKVHTCGHEFIGEVVALGSSFGGDVQGSATIRPPLYASLKVGHKVVSPFTVNCGECSVCRVGFTCRCPDGALFGSPVLDGGQAQFVRVPKAGGTLFNLSDPSDWSSALSFTERESALRGGIADSSLLLLADILPTGVFAAIQAMNHPKVLPFITHMPWPMSFEAGGTIATESVVLPEDRILVFAIIGLGPVGLCSAISLLDMLSQKNIPYKIVAIDPVAARREKMQAIYNAIPLDRGLGEFTVQSIDDGKLTTARWTRGIGCNAVLEIVGNTSALTLAFDLVRPFGAIVSVGVHQDPPMPFSGRELYNKNVSFDFGRCPARAMFPMAFDLLVRRQDVFGRVGDKSSLVEKIVGFNEAAKAYDEFDKGIVGKIVFDPWMR